MSKMQQQSHSSNSPPVKMPRAGVATTLFNHHPEEIARQLTLVEFELFSRIMVRSVIITRIKYFYLAI
jgi:hypothetical protein